MAEANPEPSMEDILSSIKRIIAEDADAALSGPRVKRSVGLTPMSQPEPQHEQSDVVDDDDVLELTDPVAIEPVAKPTLPPVTPPEPPKSRVEAEPPAAGAPRTEKRPALVSAKTADASRSSLAALSALIVKPEITGSDTLEGLVREMLKPMLADWLDERLPDMVERLVAQEIARITARG